MRNEVKSEPNIPYLRIAIVLCFILFAAILRILPHPWNFTPVGAMALFAGAKLGRSWKAFLLPLVALFAGDLFVGFPHADVEMAGLSAVVITDNDQGARIVAGAFANASASRGIRSRSATD